MEPKYEFNFYNNEDSKTLRFFYFKHQYLVIHHHLFVESLIEMKGNVSREIFNLTLEKIYKISKELFEFLCLMEDFKMKNEETFFDNAVELENFLKEEFSNPDYYVIETIKEENSKVSKDDILDFKRFTFKNFQEILERIESVNENKAEVVEQKKHAEMVQLKMAKGAVEIFNHLSELASSLELETDSKTKFVLQMSIDNALKILDKLDIEEIPTYGTELDGNHMKSLGTVENSLDNELSQDCVAVVYKKAFKLRNSNKIIQEALVKTIK